VTARLALTGSSRNAILSVILFFVCGAVLLALVDVREGQRSGAAAQLM
jgi:UMF1 family MFS transporter